MLYFIRVINVSVTFYKLFYKRHTSHFHFYFSPPLRSHFVKTKNFFFLTKHPKTNGV